MCSTLWSPTQTFTLVRALQLAILYAVAVAATRLMPTGRLLRALGGAVLAYVLISATLSALFPWAGGGFIQYNGYRRFSWFSVHPITAGTMVGVAALMTISLGLFSGRGWRERQFRLPIWLYLLPLVGVLAATNSRGPTAAFLAGTGALLVRKHLRVWTVLTLVASTIALLVFFASSGETMADLITQLAGSDPRVAEMLLRGQSVSDVQGFSGRTELWTAAWPLVRQRPLLGFGFQGSRSALLAATPWASYAHNAFLQTLLDLGAVGVLLLWGTVVHALVTLSRPRQEMPPEMVWWHSTAFAIIVFLVVNSVTSESFSAAPDIESLLLLASVLVGARIRSLPPGAVGAEALPADAAVRV